MHNIRVTTSWALTPFSFRTPINDDNSDDPINWVVLAPPSSKSRAKTIFFDVVASGTGGLPEVKEHVKEDNISIIGFRVSIVEDTEKDTVEKDKQEKDSDATASSKEKEGESDDENTAGDTNETGDIHMSLQGRRGSKHHIKKGKAVSVRARFVKILFVGSKMPMMKKAKIMAQAPKHFARFKNTVLSFTAQGDLKEFSQENIAERLSVVESGREELVLDFRNEALVAKMEHQVHTPRRSEVPRRATPRRRPPKAPFLNEISIVEDAVPRLSDVDACEYEPYNVIRRRTSVASERDELEKTTTIDEYTDENRKIDLKAYGKLVARIRVIGELCSELQKRARDGDELPGLLDIQVKGADGLTSPKLKDEKPHALCQIMLWRSRGGKRCSVHRGETSIVPAQSKPRWNASRLFRLSNIFDAYLMLNVKHQRDDRSFVLGRSAPLCIAKDVDSDIDVDFYDKYVSEWTTVDLKKSGKITFRLEWSPKNCGLYHRLACERKRREYLRESVSRRLRFHGTDKKTLDEVAAKFYEKESLEEEETFDLKATERSFDFDLKDDVGVNLGHEKWDTNVVTGVNPKSKCARIGVRPMWVLSAVNGTAVTRHSEMMKILTDVKETYKLTFRAPPLPVIFDDGYWPAIECDLDKNGDGYVMMRVEEDDENEDDALIALRWSQEHRMITARVPLKKSGVHAWNIRFLDLREDGEIRIGVCDESVDVNAVLGSDTHGWAFSSSGGIFHNGARHPHPVPKARDGDSGDGEIDMIGYDLSGDGEIEYVGVVNPKTGEVDELLSLEEYEQILQKTNGDILESVIRPFSPDAKASETHVRAHTRFATRESLGVPDMLRLSLLEGSPQHNNLSGKREKWYKSPADDRPSKNERDEPSTMPPGLGFGASSDNEDIHTVFLDSAGDQNIDLVGYDLTGNGKLDYIGIVNQSNEVDQLVPISKFERRFGTVSKEASEPPRLSIVNEDSSTHLLERPLFCGERVQVEDETVFRSSPEAASERRHVSVAAGWGDDGDDNSDCSGHIRRRSDVVVSTSTANRKSRASANCLARARSTVDTKCTTTRVSKGFPNDDDDDDGGHGGIVDTARTAYR
eukprot:g3356.t1